MSVIKDLLRVVPFVGPLLAILWGVFWDTLGVLSSAAPIVDSQEEFIALVVVVSFVLDALGIYTFGQQFALIEPAVVLVWNLVDVVWVEVVDPLLDWLVNEIWNRYIV